jgi:hypothetical protein
MSDTKQTAVEYIRSIYSRYNKIPKEIFEKALAMEREQIVEARVSAPIYDCAEEKEYIEEAEQYYTDNYGNK